MVNAADWEALMPNGQNTINIGSVTDSSSSDISSFTPTVITINGISCTITAPPNVGR